MLLVDAHLDLAMNALEWNRDLTRDLAEIRRRERSQDDRPDRGHGVVCLPEMRRGEIGICIATLIARHVNENSALPGWHSPEIAWAVTQGQLAWYRAMEDAGELLRISDAETLERAIQLWHSDRRGGHRPIAYLLSMEGADSILTPDHLAAAHAVGLRAVGPAHYGPGRYAPGTGAEGPFTPAGRELLRGMDQLKMALDVTHLTDTAFWQALDLFRGLVWASHNNCRALVDHQRQLSDRQLRALFERDAVIGVAADAWMLQPGWVIGKTQPSDVGLTIDRLVDHIDYICQLAGSARHCGIGSDLDGGYGREQCPADLNSIADLQRLGQLLADRGYGESDVVAIMQGNWLRMLRRLLSGEQDRDEPAATEPTD